MANTTYETASRLFLKELIEPARRITNARTLFGSTLQLPKGKISMEIEQIKEMGSGVISHTMPKDTKYDGITMIPRTIKIPFFSKQYTIDREKWNAYINDGTPLDMFNLRAALYQLNLREESTLILGWKPDGSTYTEGVLGLFNAAANSSTAIGTTGTYGNNLATLNGLIAMLRTDNIFGVNFNYVMEYSNWLELMSQISYGQKEVDLMRPILNPYPNMPKGDVIFHDSMAEGTCMLVPVDPEGIYIQLAKSYDYTVDIGTDSKTPQTSDIYVTLFEGIAPFYRQVDGSGTTNAIAKATSGL